MNAFGRIQRMVLGAVAMARASVNGSESVDTVTISGRAPFRRSIRAALVLIRDRELPAWSTLSTHVNRIVEGWRTFIIVDAHPSFIFIDRSCVEHDVPYMAGVLAHLACSCQLHRDFEALNPGRKVPRVEYSGPAAKERCERAYRECVDALSE